MAPGDLVISGSNSQVVRVIEKIEGHHAYCWIRIFMGIFLCRNHMTNRKLTAHGLRYLTLVTNQISRERFNRAKEIL